MAGLKSLARGKRVSSNSPGKFKIPCPLGGRITNALIYGKGRKSETDFVGKVKKDLTNFATQAKTETNDSEAI